MVEFIDTHLGYITLKGFPYSLVLSGKTLAHRALCTGQKVYGQDKKSMDRTKSLWTGQQVYGQDKKSMDRTKSLWTGQKVYGQDKKSMDRTKSLWTGQQVYGQDKKSMDRTKSLWTGQQVYGQDNKSMDRTFQFSFTTRQAVSQLVPSLDHYIFQFRCSYRHNLSSTVLPMKG